MKALVVYYSLTGNTKVIAQAIGQTLNASIEKIEEVPPYSGLMGKIRAGFQVVFRRASPIKNSEFNPVDFDIILLGSPVWASNIPPPMRTYIREHKAQFNKIAFFCTEKRAGGFLMFDRLESVIGKAAVATLEINEKEIQNQTYEVRMSTFTNGIG